MKSEKILSEKVQSLAESATLRMSALAANLRREGNEVISLSLGEPDFDTPKHIKDAVKTALDQGFTKYTPVPGLIELRTAIQKKLKRDNNLDYEINQIVVSTGAKQSITNIVEATINPGDEAILFTPYWVSYYDIISLAGGKPVCIKTTIENDFKVTPEQLANAITEKTKFILFSSPCNPTGSVYSESELRAIAKIIDNKDILIVSDEIYEYINYTDQHFSIGQIDSVKDQTITVNGFSKGYAMTGWRLGYMAAPQFIADACIKIQGQCTSGANAFAQKASITAIEGPMTETQRMKEIFKSRKELVRSMISQIPGFKVNNPKGAFYMFPDISGVIGKTSVNGFRIENSENLAEYLLKEAGVAVVAGSAFGLENHVRISFASSEDELKLAIDRIKEAILKLQ